VETLPLQGRKCFPAKTACGTPSPQNEEGQHAPGAKKIQGGFRRKFKRRARTGTGREEGSFEAGNRGLAVSKAISLTKGGNRKEKNRRP